MSPSVSVIIPAYNVERYIRQCLQSVLSQNDADYEIVLIDDASTDRTLAIARELLDDLPHAKIVALAENGGQARARNVGLDIAEGEFVAFLDSDDFYLTNSALAGWLRSARELSADLVRCGFIRVTEAGRHRSDGPDLGIQDRSAFASVEVYPRLVNISSSWQFLVRRRLLAENGIRFSPRLRQREDRLFFTEALLKARCIGVIPERLVAHRIHPASTMHNVSLDQLRQFAIHIEELNRLMRDVDVAAFPTFLRENLAFYYASALGYWRPLIKLGASRKAEPPGEVKAFIDALGGAEWTDGLLSEIKYLELTDYKEERFLEGDADLLRALAKHKQHRLFCEVVAGYRLRPEIVLSLPKETRDGIEETACRHMSFTRETSFRAALGRRMPTLASKPAIVLHCGMPKTGTSALQAYFETNRLRLLEGGGVYYPLSGVERGRHDRRNRTAGHAYLFDNLFNDEEPGLDELLAELALLDGRVRTVVLSCENLVSHRFWRGADTLKKIAAAFAGYQVTPVVFFRAQADWLESMYVELVSNPNTEMALEPDAFVRWQESVGFLDYDRVSGAFEEVFGGACKFLAYSGANGEDTVRAFFDATKLPRPVQEATVPTERRNLSATAEFALLARLLKEKGVAPRLRARMLATAARAGQSADNSEPTRLIPRRTLEAVIARHADGNVRVEQRHLTAVALAPEGALDRPLATLEGIAIPAPILLAALRRPPWPFPQARRWSRSWAQSNNRLVTFLRAWAHPVQISRRMRGDGGASKGDYARPALLLLIRVYVTLRSRRTTIARFDRNPRAYLRDSGDPFLRASGRRLFG